MAINPNLKNVFGGGQEGAGNLRTSKTNGSSTINQNDWKIEIDRNGLVKKNKFEVHFGVPFPINSDISRAVVMRADTVTMPGVNLSTAQDTNIYGPVREIVDGVNFAETVDINFILDRSFMIRDFFDAWQRTSYDEQTWNLRYYNDYIGTVDIFALDEGAPSTLSAPAGQLPSPTFGLRLWEAFPKTIGPVEFSNATVNEYAVIPISFAFRYWTDISVHGSAQPFESVLSIGGTSQQQILEQTTSGTTKQAIAASKQAEFRRQISELGGAVSSDGNGAVIRNAPAAGSAASSPF